MSKGSSYWCCKAQFGQHEPTCKNYKGKREEITMTDTYYALETPFGRVWMRPTSASHISISGGTNLNTEAEYPEGSRMGPITVHRVSYAYHGHLYRYADGTWHHGLENDRNSQIHEPYMTKNSFVHPYKSYNDSLASHAALTKVREVLEPLVTAWVKANPRIMAAAEQEDVKDKAERLRNDIAEKQAAIDNLRRELEQLELRLMPTDVLTVLTEM